MSMSGEKQNAGCCFLSKREVPVIAMRKKSFRVLRAHVEGQMARTYFGLLVVQTLHV